MVNVKATTFTITTSVWPPALLDLSTTDRPASSVIQDTPGTAASASTDAILNRSGITAD